MPNERPFVPVEASERARKGLKPNLADCRRIREVWLERQRMNQAPDAGHKSSAAWGYAIELRAIAEEEAEVALGLLDQARKAIEAALPHAVEYRDCIVESESIDGELDTLDADCRAEVDRHDAAITRMKDIIAAIDAANQE